ncbi:MAG: hypothetical protein R2711_12845 [Acidimicrobiales bacterium]
MSPEELLVPRDPGVPEAVEIYDTTLRDGAQLEGISLTVDDKLRIADELDELGVHFIEGGWPGANPKDIEFFERAGRSCASNAPCSWPSGPRDGRAARSTTIRRSATCSTPARRRSASWARAGTTT